jgi:hypothetical protein
MPKPEVDITPDVSSRFIERRRLRRIRMIAGLTLHVVCGDDKLSHREARCLVDCARKAILELHPGFEQRFENVISPHFQRALRQRWPLEEAMTSIPGEMVN